jgi:hypothetical protein
MKQEARFRKKRLSAGPSRLEDALSERIPEKLEETLYKAFSKAFALVFHKGAGLIEKTYSKDRRRAEYLEAARAARERQDRASYRAFSLRARNRSAGHVLFAGVEGVGLGLLGIGLPDIPLFSAVLLRSIYEIAMSYGFGYESPEEQCFILLVIEAALLDGDDHPPADEALNHWIDWGKTPTLSQQEQIDRCAHALANRMLYMKFIQGIPLVGALGGLSDGVCLHRVTEYSKIKYKRRFLRQGMALHPSLKLD